MAVLDVAVTKLLLGGRNVNGQRTIDFQAFVSFELDGRHLRGWAGPQGLELYD
jgi:hypothetical protein